MKCLKQKDKKKKLKIIGKIIQWSKKIKPWLLATILLILEKKKKSVMSIRLYISIIIKKVTILVIALSLKTSINFGNFYTNH